MLAFLHPKRAVINDINSELITTYEVIKNNPNELMLMLDKMKDNHNKELFYKTRNRIEKDSINIASRFIYLNKTCFNGLYRVNSEGKFNVPFNNKLKDKLNLYNESNIIAWSNYLNNEDVKILNVEYLEVLDLARSGDFIYCDPPYDYEVGVDGFDSYNKLSFGQENQKKLASKLKELNNRNVKWMLSNHNTKLINELYSDFNIINIKTNRMINSNSKKRVNAGDELVVINYEI